jgi:hypothetical protein
MATTATPVSNTEFDSRGKSEIEVHDTMKRVMAEGRIRLNNELARLRALGIIDEQGNLLKKDLPPDMQPGADRDFGG